MKKKEKILVAVTVIMVLVLAVCAYFDRTSALMGRTLAYELPADTKVVDIDKHGFLFYRVGYEAKVEINPENPEEILDLFTTCYGNTGEQLSYSDFEATANYMFENFYSYVSLKPQPLPGTGIWMQDSDTADGHHILHFIDLEEGNHAYLYIYYVR